VASSNECRATKGCRLGVTQQSDHRSWTMPVSVFIFTRENVIMLRRSTIYFGMATAIGLAFLSWWTLAHRQLAPDQVGEPASESVLQVLRATGPVQGDCENSGNCVAILPCAYSIEPGQTLTTCTSPNTPCITRTVGNTMNQTCGSGSHQCSTSFATACVLSQNQCQNTAQGCNCFFSPAYTPVAVGSVTLCTQQ
jgi:hypothetical protein